MTFARRPPLRLGLVGLAGLAVAVSAAAQGGAGSRFYEDALQRFEKKDYAGTVVQLKNVLKADSKNLSAQVLLGKALLENGEVNAAEVALTEALRLGANRAEVVVPMAKATIAQGKSDAVLGDSRFDVAGLPGPTQYQVLLLRAAAATDIADLKAALKAVTDARALNAEDAGSYLTEVPVRIRGRQLKEALAAADRAVALAPNDPESHFARGEALHVVPDLKAATASYDKALALEPTHLGALIARAGVHMDFGRLEPAAADVEAALKKSPREPRALYLKALIAERQGRSGEARAALNEVTALIDVIPPQYLRYRPQTQMLGGLAHHGLGQREKAKPYLEGVLRTQPGHTVAKVLAQIHLAERAYDRALETLDGYLRVNPRDTQAMLLAASAHMAQGRHARAAQITRDALKLGEQAQLRTTLGLSLVGGGQFAEAIKEFETVYARDPKNLQAGYALASLYVQSRQVAPATRVTEALARAHPGNGGVFALLGEARRLKGDAAGARAAYENAIKLDPAQSAAVLGLARLDMDAQAWQAAAAKLNALLARDDKNLDAALLVAELSVRTGRLDEAQRWLKKADELSTPTDPGPALALVDFHLSRGQLAPAQEAVRRAASKAPDAVPVLVATARVNMLAGDVVSARSTLARAASTSNHNVPQLTQIAGLQLKAGAPQAAGYTLDKALGERPDHVPALALRAEVDIRQGEFGPAEQRIKRLQALQPRSGLGHALAADLATARKQPEAALAAARKAHELDKSTASVMRLMVALLRRDRPAAIKLAEQWVAAHPADALVWRALADTQFNAGNLPAARAAYETLLKVEVKDWDAMNNLAHVLVLQKDPQALRIAEQALALAPTAPHVIGTAGWAAFKSGQNDRAIQLLRDARVRDPASADTRYYLASVLASMGRGSEARAELVAALQSTGGFSHRADAEQLLGTLK